MNTSNKLLLAVLVLALAFFAVFYRIRVDQLQQELHVLKEGGFEAVSEQRAAVRNMERVLQAAQITAKMLEDRNRILVADLGEAREKNEALREELTQWKPGVAEALDRDVFEENAMGMGRQALIQYIGKPSSVLGPNGEWWYYESGITRNTGTGQVDKMVQVHFRNGRVAEINFP